MRQWPDNFRAPASAVLVDKNDSVDLVAVERLFPIVLDVHHVQILLLERLSVEIARPSTNTFVTGIKLIEQIVAPLVVCENSGDCVRPQYTQRFGWISLRIVFRPQFSCGVRIDDQQYQQQRSRHADAVQPPMPVIAENSVAASENCLPFALAHSQLNILEIQQHFVNGLRNKRGGDDGEQWDIPGCEQRQVRPAGN